MQVVMSPHRQLAAILFTDIEGYSALMQQNEPVAISLRNRHREILQQQHEHFNGTVIQYYGDGTLSIFSSAVQAVQCASAMQQQYCLSPRVPVRMGLHIGDIIYDAEQAIGDGVNLAARIESLGVAGSVLLSDKVNDEIQNHPHLSSVSVGSYQFKNISRQVEVFALNQAGLVLPVAGSLAGKTVESMPVAKPGAARCQTKSVAVMPLLNLSNDPDQEYFNDGMAEEILNCLSHISKLKVAGRTSSFQFKGQPIDLREVGRKLGVSTVLEGSVRRQGRQLRVTVQLINVKDGFHLWSEKFDREMDDVFAIQDEIALAITQKMRETLMEKKPGRQTSRLALASAADCRQPRTKVPHFTYASPEELAAV
jgi:adenylate cyclase